MFKGTDLSSQVSPSVHHVKPPKRERISFRGDDLSGDFKVPASSPVMIHVT